MKRIWIGIGVLALVVVVCIIAGEHPQQGWPPLSPTRPGADIAQVAHPPAEVMTTLHRDCYNCHSDHPNVPWYGHVWPSSAQVQDDIHRASARLNFSEWDQLSPEMARVRASQVCMMVSTGKMPLWYYKPLHPEATLNANEVFAICNWASSVPPMLTAQQASTK